MTKEQIIKKVVEKAIKNGFDFWKLSKEKPTKQELIERHIHHPEKNKYTVKNVKFYFGVQEPYLRLPDAKLPEGKFVIFAGWKADITTYDTRICKKCKHQEKYSREYFSSKDWRFHEFIFSHDFAKAIFGEERVDGVGQTIAKKMLKFCRCEPQFAWQYHLQQMVLAPKNERLKYLKKFL